MTAPSGTEPRVERTYRALLRCYPADFRSEYGEEVLGTVMEGAGEPPQVRTREAAGLVLAGLRCRATTGRRARPTSLADGARLGVLLVLGIQVMLQAGGALGGMVDGVGTVLLALLLPVTYLLVLRGQLRAAALLEAARGLESTLSAVTDSFGRSALVFGLGLAQTAIVVGLLWWAHRAGSTAPFRRPWSWFVPPVIGVALVGFTPALATTASAALVLSVVVAAVTMAAVLDTRAATALAVLLVNLSCATATIVAAGVGYELGALAWVGGLLLVAVGLLARGARGGRPRACVGAQQLR